MVVTTSCRPPRSCALSCVKTPGTCPRFTPSTVSNVNRCDAKPNDTWRAPIVSARSTRIGPKLCVVRSKTPVLGSRRYVKPDAGDGKRYRDELTDECRAELAEVRLKVVVEVRRVRLLARERGLAVDDEAVRPDTDP